MNFTFGIITNGTCDSFITKIINSIEKQIKNYEIIIVGNSNINRNNTKIIKFDESVKEAWITRKKNIITKNASFDNIVYLHDYIVFEDDWYEGFLKFGNDFDVCMNKILTPNGKRYRDWTIDAMANIIPITGIERRYERLLPYNEFSFNDIMYFSGAYWVAKKDFMKKFPLDERLSWGESEDIEWSYRVRKNTKFSMNSHSTVRLLKDKGTSFEEVGVDLLFKLKTLPKEDFNNIITHSENYYNRTFK